MRRNHRASHVAERCQIDDQAGGLDGAQPVDDFGADLLDIGPLLIVEFRQQRDDQAAIHRFEAIVAFANRHGSVSRGFTGPSRESVRTPDRLEAPLVRSGKKRRRTELSRKTASIMYWTLRRCNTPSQTVRQNPQNSRDRIRAGTTRTLARGGPEAVEPVARTRRVWTARFDCADNATTARAAAW